MACARFRRSGGFRMVQLNAVGWLAVLTPGVALGVAIAAVVRWSLLLGAVVGGLFSWVVAVAVDTFRWRNSSMGVDVTDLDLAIVQAAIADLRAIGVDVQLDTSNFASVEGVEVHLRARMKHRQRVEAALAAHGL